MYRMLLQELIRFRSISTDSQYAQTMHDTAAWLQQQFALRGFTSEVVTGYGNPIVVAQVTVNPDQPFTMIYGHYDVQPADRSDGWESEPFELTERNGKLYGRGVVDNKGQVLIHIASVFALLEQGSLAKNTLFVLEGDEETGGSGIGKWLNERGKEFAVNEVIISDGEMPYQPVMTAALRGSFNTTVTVRTANTALHSGLFGGATPNAAQELAQLITQLNDPTRYLAASGIFTDQAPSTAEKELAQTLDSQRQSMLDQTGVQKFFTDTDGSFSVRTGLVSMITVSGMTSGYVGEGYANIIPNTATAKINVRVAAGSDAGEVFERLSQVLRTKTPAYVQLEVASPDELVGPVKVDVTAPAQQAVRELLSGVYGKPVLVEYCGATLPVVTDIQQVFGVDPLLVSLGNDDCNMHGINENYDIQLIKRGLAFSERFFGKQSA